MASRLWHRIGSSDWLPYILDKFLPHPARFRLIWSVTQGKSKLHAWEPIPPGPAFVALGVVCTKTPTDPDPTSVRCVPREWCAPSEHKGCVWNDSGAGGRSGSIWHINKMYLMRATVGHDPPRAECFELKR